MQNDSQKGRSIEYTRDQLWDMYVEIGIYERHFNTVQERYRLITSSWLLATVAAMAYVFVNKENFTFGPIEIVVSSLAYFGSIGISLLWILDVKVYQVLLSSYYEEALALERGQHWLPQVRRKIRRKFQGKLPKLIGVYYVGTTFFLFLLGTAILATYVYQCWPESELFQLELSLASVLALIDAGIVVAVYVQSSQTGVILENDAADFSEDSRRNHYIKAVIEAPKKK